MLCGSFQCLSISIVVGDPIIKGNKVRIPLIGLPRHMFVPVSIRNLEFHRHKSEWFYFVFNDLRTKTHFYISPSKIVS